MAEAKYVFDSKSINKISEEFINSRKELSEVTVEAIPYAESENTSGGTTVTIG